jgi:hypothetical protein
MLDCGAAVGRVPAWSVAEAAPRYAALTGGACLPQLAAVIFDAAGNPRCLDHYFPLARALSGAERDSFDALVRAIASHPSFDLRLFGPGRADLTAELPVSARSIVAGHLAETFFYRRDLLDRLLCAPRHFYLYTTRAAFADDGGEAGGCFNPEREALQLVLSRLFEGFFDEWPGVAPFLHEFGHLLDFFDAGTGRLGRSRGLLPGLSHSDGAVFTPAARELFLRGKALERDRYLARQQGRSGPDDPFPIGHPYVFQNDTEFAAGYFEMFFRNPHYLAQLNPDLHAGYVALFGYDPRRCWPRDFPFYVASNRKFYLSGEPVWPIGITIPELG